MIPHLKTAAGVRSLRLSQDAIMSPAGPPPYSRVLHVSFDSLADVMAVVEESKQLPEQRDRHARLAPLILLYEVSEQ